MKTALMLRALILGGCGAKIGPAPAEGRATQCPNLRTVLHHHRTVENQHPKASGISTASATDEQTASLLNGVLDSFPYSNRLNSAHWPHWSNIRRSAPSRMPSLG